MSGPDPRELNALLDHLQVTAVELHRTFHNSRLHEIAEEVVLVVGTRSGVMRITPEHAGKATYAVTLVTRRLVALRLRALEEPEAADEIEAGAAAKDGAIDMLVVTADWVAVVDLVPDPSTAPGGAA